MGDREPQRTIMEVTGVYSRSLQFPYTSLSVLSCTSIIDASGGQQWGDLR